MHQFRRLLLTAPLRLPQLPDVVTIDLRGTQKLVEAGLLLHLLHTQQLSLLGTSLPFG